VKAMSVKERVKRFFQKPYHEEDKAKRRQEKQEREKFERETRRLEHKQYVKTLETETRKRAVANARLRAKRDARGRGGTAKGVGGFLSNAGKNLLQGNDQMDLAFHNMGIPGYEKKPIPKTNQNLSGASGTTIRVDGTTITINKKPTQPHKKTHVKKRKTKIFNPLNF